MDLNALFARVIAPVKFEHEGATYYVNRIASPTQFDVKSEGEESEAQLNERRVNTIAQRLACDENGKRIFDSSDAHTEFVAMRLPFSLKAAYTNAALGNVPNVA